MIQNKSAIFVGIILFFVGGADVFLFMEESSPESLKSIMGIADDSPVSESAAPPVSVPTIHRSLRLVVFAGRHV